MSPSEFLLRWNERPGLWCFVQAWVPVRTERYSWGRVVAIIALFAGVAALIMAPLAVASGKPIVRWVALMTVEFAACAGLCFGLASWFCWNRRASRLVAWLATTPDLPEATRPWPAAGFWRQTEFVLFYGMATVWLALLPFHALENARATWAWRQLRAELKAKGECFELPCIIPPPAADGENFFATPFWQKFLYRQESLANGRVTNIWLHPDEFAAQPDFRLPSNPSGLNQRGMPSKEPIDGHVNLAAWAQEFRSAGTKAGKGRKKVSSASFPVPETPGEPAADVLFALTKFDPMLAEFAGAAARPRNRYPVHYEEGFGAMLPALAALKGSAQVCRLRAIARLETGDSAGAATDVLLAYRLGASTQEEPILISQLVRVACDAIAHQALWEGLATHRWSDTQLVAFQERLSRLDYAPLFLRALEGERALGNLLMERMITEPGYAQSIGTPDFTIGEDTADNSLFPQSKILPAGWLRQNHIQLLRGYQLVLDHARLMMRTKNRTDLAGNRHGEEADDAYLRPVTGDLLPFNIMAKMFLSSLRRATAKAEHAQTVAQMALIACALERHHLAHGTFPVTLGELAPAYLPDVPLDWMSGEPFHYERTDDGWFRLWSVGPDGKDDHGATHTGPANQYSDLPDWPWPSPVPSREPRLF